LQVVQAIGAPESEALNFGNPKKIDGDGAIALVDAAVALGIDQYVMVTSLGTANIGFPAGRHTAAALHAPAYFTHPHALTYVHAPFICYTVTCTEKE